MGNTTSSDEEKIKEEFLILSPKPNNCPKKSFPIPIKQNIYLKDTPRESMSLPNSFEKKMIKQKQENDKTKRPKNSMGRQISSQENHRYNFTSLYFENYQEYGES